MSLFAELTHLEAFYAVSLVNPLSCPRNLMILWSKITDLRTALPGLSGDVTLGWHDTTGQDEMAHLEAVLKPLPQDEETSDIRLWELGC